MKFIFVGGCGRSGTTLLQKILLSHSKISGGSEFYFSDEIFSLYKKMTNSFFIDHNSIYYSKEEAQKSFKEFYTSFFKHLARTNPVYISEKTPTNINVAQEILEVFPESYYINVIRDGRDVVSSYLKVARRHKENNKKTEIGLKYACELWLNSVNRWAKIENHPRTFNVYYEDLILEPEKTIVKLLKFLKLDMESQLLSPEKVSAESVNMQSNQDTMFYTKQMMMQPFNPKRIGSWKNELGLFQKIFTNIFLSNKLKAFGYKITNSYYTLNRVLVKIFV